MVDCIINCDERVNWKFISERNGKESNINRHTLLIIVALVTPVLAFTTQAFIPTEQTAVLVVEITPNVIQVDTSSGETSIDSAALATAIAPMGTGELSAEEADGLLLMREEEKLAHDVYIYLFDKWGLNIFKNISNSEQTHTDAIKTLLDRYGLNDPAIGKAEGEFTNETLQRLYDQLVDSGSKSLSDALKVGAAVEEIDIIDLQEKAALTNRQDILLVYQNLETGSRNHLRSFTKTLQAQTDEVYQPQYLTTEAYESIINTGIETGRGNGRGRKP